MKKHEIIKYALDAYEKAAVEIEGPAGLEEIKRYCENNHMISGVCNFIFKKISIDVYCEKWTDKHKKVASFWAPFPGICESVPEILQSFQTRISILRGEHILSLLENCEKIIPMSPNANKEVYDWCEGYDFYFDMDKGIITRLDIHDKDADFSYDIPEIIEDEICDLLQQRFDFN